MRLSHVLLLALFALLACVAVGTLAQDADAAEAGDEAFEGTDVFGLGQSKDVGIRYVFPDFPERKIPAGEVVDIVLGFANRNSYMPYNVTTAFAQLTAPEDFKSVLYNFSMFRYDQALPPKESTAIVYKFRTDPNMEPRELGLVLRVFYNDEIGNQFGAIGFNGTIDFVEPARSLDVQSVLAYLLMLAMAGGAGYGVYMLVNSTPKKGSKKSSVERGTSAASSANIDTFESELLRGSTKQRASRKQSAAAE